MLAAALVPLVDLAPVRVAALIGVLAQEDTGLNPLGDDLLPYLVLALGGAMAVGSVLALVRPPQRRKEGELEQAPVGRSIAFALVGAVGAVWALASLVAG